FLSRHDLVYLGPVADGLDGLPIGDGDVGAMLWTPPDHLRLQVNKCDLWDDGPPGPFTSWGEEDEEVSTMLRSAATLAIGHGLPVFDRVYLTDFEARLRLAEAVVALRAETPFARAAAEHRRAWARFWQASFVQLPPEQEYAENLWYLGNYYLASGSRGRYPLVQTNGVWGWTRDVRPWAHYYHWNTGPLFWPLYAAGHPDLALPHLRCPRAMLGQAVADARRVHGGEGAFFSDAANRAGYQATERGLSHNLTPGPQIAADLWRHYRYTGDEPFLEELAYPVVREVARFYLS